MSQNKKEFVRIIIFGILLVLALCRLSDMALVNLRGMYNYEPFYEIEKNTVEAVFVGPSTCYCGISPMRLYDQYGISAQVFGSSNQSMLSNYLWAKEAYKSQKYRVLAVEASSVMFPYGEPKRNIAALYSMGKSGTYFELAYRHKFKGINVLLPVIPYHDFWKKIEEYNYQKNPNPETAKLRGFCPIGSHFMEEGILLADSQDGQILSINTEYLDEIVNFCDENQIKLVLFKTAMCNEEQWSSSWHNTIQNYADSRGIEFVDFNTAEYLEAAKLNMQKDVAEDGNHLNISGAHKVTDWFGDYFVNMQNVEWNFYNSDDEFSEEVICEYYQLTNAMLE